MELCFIGYFGVMRLLIALLLSMAYSAAAGQETFIFEHDGLQREYILYTPDGNTDGMPLVFNLHGYTSNATQQMIYSNMNEVADAEGFAVCYPQGTLDEFDFAHWNSSLEDGVIDDVGFLMELALSLQEAYGFDPQRTFTCGFSNGGFMSYSLSCAGPTIFRAMACVAGSMTQVEFDNCYGAASVPVFIIHGNLDPIVPYNGSEILPEGWGSSMPVEDVVELWVTENNYCDDLSSTPMANINLLDLCTVIMNVYSNCLSGNEVWFYEVEGGGHTWPGAFPTVIVGATNQDFDASQRIWEFFDGVAVTNIPEAQVEVRIGPNPVMNELRIQTQHQFDEVLLTTASGQAAFRVNFRATEISLAHLSTGMYFLHLLSNGEIISRSRVVKY